MRSIIAAHIENLLFLLLIVVAGLFQLLAKAAAKTGKNQTKRTSTPRTPPPIPQAATESDEERIRKFLEALGQPPTSKPPPPVIPRTNIPPRPLAPVQPPISPLSQLKREKPRKRQAASKEIPLPQPVRSAEKIVQPAFEVREGAFPIAPPPIVKAPAGTSTAVMRISARAEQPRADIAMLLASASGLRGAIILREILGPPRGLRAIDVL
ncbi:MAG: hypothetical protein J2P56_06200 [Verrucomicrobia bacterium]|nr:hypothetical protein [Verrucomicrobiota bacterium]